MVLTDLLLPPVGSLMVEYVLELAKKSGNYESVFL